MPPPDYSSEALRQDLERIRNVWDDCQATRDRNAIYGYLNAVFGLVAWWTAEGRDVATGSDQWATLRVDMLGLPLAVDPPAGDGIHVSHREGGDGGRGLRPAATARRRS
jgi:hypothetical protein